MKRAQHQQYLQDRLTLFQFMEITLQYLSYPFNMKKAQTQRHLQDRLRLLQFLWKYLNNLYLILLIFEKGPT